MAKKMPKGFKKHGPMKSDKKTDKGPPGKKIVSKNKREE